MKLTTPRIVLIAIILLPMVAYFILRQFKPHVSQLPKIGLWSLNNKGDTLFHTIPQFQFTDQDGLPVTRNFLDSGITLVSFFFSTCKDVCPKLNGNLMNLYENHLSDPAIHLLSHTVDPETDSVPTLHEYAKKLRIQAHKWKFVTGKASDIYRQAIKGYLLPSGEEGVNPDSLKFFHSQMIVMVDDQYHIRGVYDGLSSYDIKKLEDEIRVLKYEIVHRKENGK